MKRAAKRWSIAATVLIISGILIFAGALAVVGFDFTKFSTVKYETVTREISGSFERIYINVSTAKIELVLSEDKECRMVCRRQPDTEFSADVRDKTLSVSENDDRSWFERFGLTFESPQITLYLPQKQYDTLSVNSVTGGIDIPKDFRFNSVSIDGVTSDVNCSASVEQDLSVDVVTGNVHLSSVEAGKIRVSSTTGNVRLENTVAAGDLTVSSSTGNVRFDNSDAAWITVNTSTGNVTGTLRTAKVFDAATSTGKVNVPQDGEGGRCSVTTTTGNIKLEIEDRK